jgi:AbrB family looped-hinge helix DNA binding protein
VGDDEHIDARRDRRVGHRARRLDGVLEPERLLRADQTAGRQPDVGADDVRSGSAIAGRLGRRDKPALSLLNATSKERMDVPARISSKGQVTLPKAVREALGVAKGDQVVFRVEGRRATLARTPALLDLAGAVPVPPGRRGSSWAQVRRRTRATRARARR